MNRIGRSFLWTAAEKTVSDRGPGVHILTGPVYVCGAEPGDLLEVRIIDLKPRPSANPLYPGKAFGSNAAAWWGFHYDNLKDDPNPREGITIYEMDATGQENWAKAVYRYRWTPKPPPMGPSMRPLTTLALWSTPPPSPKLIDSSAKLRDFLMNGMSLTEDEAFSLITVGADFAITQVVDGNWGVHGIIPKDIFAPETVKPKP